MKPTAIKRTIKCKDSSNNKLFKGLSINNLTIKKIHPLKFNAKIIKNSTELFKDCVVRSNQSNRNEAAAIENDSTDADWNEHENIELSSLNVTPLKSLDCISFEDELMAPLSAADRSIPPSLSDFGGSYNEAEASSDAELTEPFKRPARNSLKIQRSGDEQPKPVASERCWQHLEICFLLRQYEQHMTSLRYKESKNNFWLLISGLMQSKGFNVSV